MTTDFATESSGTWNEEQQRAYALQRTPLWLKPRYVRLRLDEPSMEATIRGVSMYCASMVPPFIAKQRACEGFLVRLLRSRMRLVRTEFLRIKLKEATDEERLQYGMKKKRVAYLQLYFSPEEMTTVKEGLEILGRRLERGLTDVERRLLLRCTVLSQAVQAGQRPHSELVREMNHQRATAMAAPKLQARSGGQMTSVAGSADLRLRMREWTVRAALFAVLSYMRYNGASPQSWKRAFKLLERVIGLHRDVIASQVRHGKPGYWLREGGMVRRGLGIEPNKQAYITPRLSIWELRMIREGLELRKGELVRAGEEASSEWRWQMNRTERVLLLKATLLYGAKYGVGRQRVGWQVGGLAKKMRARPRARP